MANSWRMTMGPLESVIALMASVVWSHIGGLSWTMVTNFVVQQYVLSDFVSSKEFLCLVKTFRARYTKMHCITLIIAVVLQPYAKLSASDRRTNPDIYLLSLIT